MSYVRPINIISTFSYVHAYTYIAIVVVVWFGLYIYIKTHDSESRGQEETAIIRETKNTRPLSELFTRKSVKKLTNALVKLP